VTKGGRRKRCFWHRQDQCVCVFWGDWGKCNSLCAFSPERNVCFS